MRNFPRIKCPCPPVDCDAVCAKVFSPAKSELLDSKAGHVCSNCHYTSSEIVNPYKDDTMAKKKEKRRQASKKIAHEVQRRTEFCRDTERGVLSWRSVDEMYQILRRYEDRCFDLVAWQEGR